MKIGYARVSTQNQKLELQIDALTRQGCALISQEKKSDKSKERPELEKMLNQLRAGDTVVVWKLDWLGRSLRDLIDLVAESQKRGVDFISLQDGINTVTTTGRFTFNIFASLAEFEREIIKERTKAGLVAAKARGRAGGRPGGLSQEASEKAKSAKILYESGSKPVDEIAKLLGISRATCYRFESAGQLTKNQNFKADKTLRVITSIAIGLPHQNSHIAYTSNKRGF